MPLYDHEKHMDYILSRSTYICSVAGVEPVLPDSSNYTQVRDAISSCPVSQTTKKRLKYELRRIVYIVEMLRGLEVEGV